MTRKRRAGSWSVRTRAVLPLAVLAAATLLCGCVIAPRYPEHHAEHDHGRPYAYGDHDGGNHHWTGDGHDER